MNRLLFYGDSGCGKTYLSKALSNYLGFEMLYIDIANAITSGSKIFVIFDNPKTKLSK